MGVANYAIQTNFGAKDNVSPTFIRMTQSASVFQNRLNGITKTGQKVGKCVSDTINKWVGVGASFFAFNQIKSFGQQTVELAQKQITAEENLQQVLKNNMLLRAKGKDAYKGATADLINFAGELQKKGVIGDEVTIAGMQSLASSGLSVEHIKKLTEPMNDLIAHRYKLNATQENAEAIATSLGRAINGNVGALSKMNIFLSENEKKMFKTMSTNQRVDLVTRRLSKTFGGRNFDLAQTDLGAKQQALNNIGDTMEKIGDRIIPMQGIFFRAVNKHLPKLEKLIDKTFKTAEYVLKETMPAWTKLGKTIKYVGNRVFTEFNQHGDDLKNVFQNVIVPGINLTVDAIYGLSKAFFEVYDFVKSNWTTIESFLWLFGSAKLAVGILSVARAVRTLNTANIMLALSSSNFVYNGLIGRWANIEYMCRTRLIPGFTTLKNSIIGLNLLFGKTLLISGGVILLIGAVAVGAFLIWKKWGDSITNIWNGLRNKAGEVFPKIGQFFQKYIIDIFTIALGPIGLVARGIFEIGKRLNLIDGAKIATQSNINYKTTSDVNLNAKYPEPPMAQNINSQGSITIGFDKNSSSALDGATPFLSSIKTKNMNLSPI